MKLKSVLALILSTVYLASCAQPGINIELEIADQQPHEVYDNDYYKDIYRDQGGARLMAKLHRLVYDTHHTYIQYGDVASYGKKTDMAIGDASKITNFYTNKKVSSYGTREHVWPCAKSSGLWARGDARDPEADDIDKPSYKGGGSDLYHIRPCNDTVNTFRSDSLFTEFTSSDKTYMKGETGGDYSLLADKAKDANKSEPHDNFKGDIARILCYIYIHYGSFGDKYCGELVLSHVMYKRPDDPEEVVYKRLVKWNHMDPPSEQEKKRNDNVQEIQGNRNPFVDYPHLMEKMFGIESL